MSLVSGIWLLLAPTGLPASDMPEDEYGSRNDRVPVRVHLGESRRPLEEFNGVLGEINRIWSVQAGIGFVFSVVRHEEPAGQGFDLSFSPRAEGYNGFYAGPHEMRVRDIPDLKPVLNPARDPAARTAAHERGHALGLVHRQDSNENLMRSKTLGWRLSSDEIATARDQTARLEGVEITPGTCTGQKFPLRLETVHREAP